MAIRLGRFELPKLPVIDEASKTETYAKFTAEPFEAGYGVTVGNVEAIRPTLEDVFVSLTTESAQARASEVNA